MKNQPKNQVLIKGILKKTRFNTLLKVYEWQANNYFL